ncbi:hypothetical protein CF326_g782, partial [Tilletia indica]
GAKPALQRF